MELEGYMINIIDQNLKVNIQIKRKMAKEKNIYLEDYYMKENLKMVKETVMENIIIQCFPN